MRLMMLVLCGLLALPVMASADEGRFGIGLRAGGSFLTQDINNDIPGAEFEGDPGFIGSVQGFYRAPQFWTAGVALDYESHGVEAAGIDLGDGQTLTFLPYVEVRPWNGTVTPYGLFGVGVNINSFEEEDGIVEIDPDNTLAVKVGGGVDWFLAPNVALNAEAAWKYNSGDVTVQGLGTGDMNLNAINLLVGGRLLF